MVISNYKQLVVYQKAYQMALETYKLTNNFPGEEKNSLASQLQKAAVLIPANIAEGFGRFSVKEFIYFLRISLGSLNQVRVYYDLAKDLSYIKQEDFARMNTELDAISKMLNKLIKNLSESNKPKGNLQ